MTARKMQLLMSKYGFSIAIMLTELILVFGLFLYLGQMAPILWIILVILVSLATIVSIVNRSMNPESKVTWLLVAFVPVFGPLLYIMFGERRLSKKEMKQLKQLQSMVDREDNSRALRLELKEQDKSAYGVIKSLLSMDTNADVYNRTDTHFFPSGESMWRQMLEDLKKAEKLIFLEYYIIEEGLMWDSILEILEEKAAQGVEVKLLYDDIGCMATLPGDYTIQLRSRGIEAHKFNKVIPRLTVAYNNRDHRKIMIIDGQIAYTGGANLADEYINKIERFGHWKDTALMVEGPAVDTFLVLFLQMWTYSHETLDVTPYMVEHETFDTPGFVVPYGDIPLDKDKVGENVYIDILNHARDFVHIMTPYLILDGELLHALKFAAERGVDVSIIMPGIPDKKSAYYLAKTYYPTLLASGVKIYEYTPGFVHAKVFVSDNSRAVVGTINLDYRSLYHHFECATYLYRTSSVVGIEEDFQATMAKCHRVSMTDVKNRPFHQKCLGLLTRLVAPLM